MNNNNFFLINGGIQNDDRPKRGKYYLWPSINEPLAHNVPPVKWLNITEDEKKKYLNNIIVVIKNFDNHIIGDKFIIIGKNIKDFIKVWTTKNLKNDKIEYISISGENIFWIIKKNNLEIIDENNNNLYLYIIIGIIIFIILIIIIIMIIIYVK